MRSHIRLDFPGNRYLFAIVESDVADNIFRRVGTGSTDVMVLTDHNTGARVTFAAKDVLVMSTREARCGTIYTDHPVHIK